MVLLLIGPLTFYQIANAEEVMTHTNNQYGFKIQYPPSTVFKVVEEQKEQEQKQGAESAKAFPIVPFILQDAGQITIFVKPTGKYLDGSDLKVKEMTPEQYALEAKNSPTEKLSFYLGGDLNFIRSEPATIGKNITACRLDYTDSFINSQTYNIHFHAVNHYKFFHIRYNDEPLKVPDTLPIAPKMIDSFEFTTVK